MKKAVITISIGKTEDIEKLTIPFMEKYADRVGADFVCIRDVVYSIDKFPSYEKFQLKDYLDKYDRLIFVDVDAVISEDCPDLFKIVPHDMLGVRYVPWNAGKEKWIRRVNKQEGSDVVFDKYFNSGVMVVSTPHKKVFEFSTNNELCGKMIEQTYLNYNVVVNNIPTLGLDKRFNQGRGDMHEAYIAHFAGGNMDDRYSRIKKFIVEDDKDIF
jgi:lipopolysaccharide biosynthesis glycosyltransferase